MKIIVALKKKTSLNENLFVYERLSVHLINVLWTALIISQFAITLQQPTWQKSTEKFESLGFRHFFNINILYKTFLSILSILLSSFTRVYYVHLAYLLNVDILIFPLTKNEPNEVWQNPTCYLLASCTFVNFFFNKIIKQP